MLSQRGSTIILLPAFLTTHGWDVEGVRGATFMRMPQKGQRHHGHLAVDPMSSEAVMVAEGGLQSEGEEGGLA